MGSITENAYQARGEQPAPGSFEEAFYKRVDSIVKRGKEVGITITDICQQSGIARATPDRWREKAPLSITLVDKMERAVIAAEASHVASNPTPATRQEIMADRAKN